MEQFGGNEIRRFARIATFVVLAGLAALARMFRCETGTGSGAADRPVGMLWGTVDRRDPGQPGGSPWTAWPSNGGRRCIVSLSP